MQRQRRSSHSNRLASCVVASIFLVSLAAAAAVIYFSLFKPRPPQITVNAVNLPAFSLSDGAVNFTFSQKATVRNPNRDIFTHYDSSLELVYGGAQVGFMFIPAGKIEARRTKHMLATFDVESFPVAMTAPPLGLAGAAVGEATTMEIQSRMKLEGRVRVLKVFTHQVLSRRRCSVTVEVKDGSVLGFHC